MSIYVCNVWFVLGHVLYVVRFVLGHVYDVRFVSEHVCIPCLFKAYIDVCIVMFVLCLC